VNSVALRSEHDQIISGDQNGSVKFWDLTSGKCINDVKPDTWIQSVDISEDDKTLVAASNHAMVYVWDPANATDLRPITKFRALTPRGWLLFACENFPRFTQPSDNIVGQECQTVGLQRRGN
jgi:G protein beta subunit-like protein